MEDSRVTTFVKTNGLGNDYLVLRESTLAFPLTPAAVRRLCDRHRKRVNRYVLRAGGLRVPDLD